MHLLEKHSAIIPVEGKAIQWLKTFCESEEWVEIRSSNHTSDRRDIPLLDIELNWLVILSGNTNCQSV